MPSHVCGPEPLCGLSSIYYYCYCCCIVIVGVAQVCFVLHQRATHKSEFSFLSCGSRRCGPGASFAHCGIPPAPASLLSELLFSPHAEVPGILTRLRAGPFAVFRTLSLSLRNGVFSSSALCVTVRTSSLLMSGRCHQLLGKAVRSCRGGA